MMLSMRGCFFSRGICFSFSFGDAFLGDLCFFWCALPGGVVVAKLLVALSDNRLTWRGDDADDDGV